MKFSVCIAVYNGSSYLREQLDSIFNQTLSCYEVVIVDDVSNDDSRDILRSYQSKYRNIKIFENETNLGVIPSFEKAISLASGDIVVLCDQDDVWELTKLEKLSKTFIEFNPLLILHNYSVIDSNGDLTGDVSKIDQNSISILRTFMTNSYIGCCMAFKKGLISSILPFPKNIPMHDSWIGLVASVAGEVKVIDDRLIFYRRHSNNVTGNTKFSLVEKLKHRFYLAFYLIFLGKVK